MSPDAFSSLILKIGALFDGLQSNISGGSFSAASSGITWMIWGSVAVILAIYAIFLWSSDKDATMAGLVKNLLQWKVKIAMVGLLMFGAPVICSTVKIGVAATLSGLNGTVATAGAGVMNSLQQALQLIWNAQGPVKAKLKDWSPGFFDDMDGTDTLADTMAAQAAMTRLKATATEQINGQILLAKKLQATSKTQAQGAAMESQAKEALRNINKATDMAQLNAQWAQEDASGTTDSAARSGVKSWFNNPLAALTNPMIGIFSALTKIFLVVKSYIGAGVAFLGILAPLLFVLMSGWKLMEALIGVFSELARIVFFTCLGMALATTLGPFAAATFFSDKWNRYGHAFVSFLLQVVLGTSVLSLVVKMVAVGMGRFGIMISSSGSAVFANVLAANSFTDMLIAGIIGGFPFILLGFAMSFFASLISKSMSIGTGLVNGTWNP